MCRLHWDMHSLYRTEQVVETCIVRKNDCNASLEHTAFQSGYRENTGRIYIDRKKLIKFECHKLCSHYFVQA